MSRPELPRLAVVYDLGAVGPAEILASAEGLCDVVFVCDAGIPHVAATLEALRSLTQVCEITGLEAPQRAAKLAALQPDGILTFSEYQLERTADLAERCHLRFNGTGTVELLRDKLRQREALHRAGVDGTRIRAVRGVQDIPAAIAEVGPRAVLKPRRGAASRDTYPVESQEQCVALLAGIEQSQDTGAPVDFVLEELLVGDPAIAGPGWGDYISVESLVADATISHVCVTGKLPLAHPFRETGMFVPSSLPAPLRQVSLELATAALRALGVRYGATHTELKLTRDGPRIIEVNGRLGGYIADLVLRSTGFDLPAAIMRVALGGLPQVAPLEHRRIAFQYFLVAPPEAVELVAIEGAGGTRQLAGVRRVQIDGRPGQPLDLRSGTLTRVGVVYGEAASHAELGATVAALKETIAIVSR